MSYVCPQHAHGAMSQARSVARGSGRTVHRRPELELTLRHAGLVRGVVDRLEEAVPAIDDLQARADECEVVVPSGRERPLGDRVHADRFARLTSESSAEAFAGLQRTAREDQPSP